MNKRLHEEGLVRLDDELHLIAGNVDARHLLDDLVHLGDDDAVLERGRLDDGRCVLGIRPGAEIAVTVSTHCGNQGNVGGEVDEVPGKQFEISVNCPELDLAAEQHGSDARGLRPGIGKVEPLRHAAIEQVEMFR